MTAATTCAPASVPLREVERELRRQLMTLQGPAKEPVLQARMSNLVVYCDSRERANEIAAQVPAIAQVHPARVLLLVGESGPESVAPVATVQVHGEELGGRAHSCSDLVTLTARGPAVDRLPFAVRALVIGDLPTNLWWAAPQPPPLAGPLLYELAECAEQVIYDSIGWREPVRGVAATAAWLGEAERPGPGGRWRVASDLNWRRLKYWRRLVAQSLDPATAPGVAESVTEVVAEHGPHAIVQAWELVTWLSQRLGWRLRGGRVKDGEQVSWQFAGGTGEVIVRVCRLAEGPPNIRRLRMVCTLNGKPGALNLAVQEENRLAITLEGVEGEPRTITIPALTPAELIGRQLSDRERDPAFRESMAIARQMAEIVLE